MALTKAEIRALADKISASPEQQKIVDTWVDELEKANVEDSSTKKH